MSKLILRDQEIINVVVTTLIGTEALNPQAGQNGIKSDVIYAPSIVSASFPPMLVEIHHTVTKLS
ncbi:hypothetical protein BD408DRAFT_409651 [Parasitella parasitica]|nr:hypothetical protein BD408DRAFT_409651 [Parasitella parasitica]